MRAALLPEVEKAYAFYRRHEWIQGEATWELDDGRTGYCLAAVLEMYSDDLVDCDYCDGPHRSISPHTNPLTGLAKAIIRWEWPERNWAGVIEWNDHPGRTKADVDALWVKMLQAAEALDEVRGRESGATTGA